MYFDIFLMVYFLFLALLADKGRPVYWVIVFYILTFNTITSFTDYYISDVVIAGMMTGSCAVLMTFNPLYSKQSIKQCVIMCLASFVHSLMYVNLTIGTRYMYDHYEIVLFLLILAQMVVSRHGLANAIHNFKNTLSNILSMLQYGTVDTYSRNTIDSESQTGVLKA